MQTTRFNETSQGTIAVTYTDPYDLPMIAKMVAEHREGVSVWKVIVSVGGPGNWVYGPVLASFDFDNETWFIGAGETAWQLEHGDMYVLDHGDLNGPDQKIIFNILKKGN